MPWMPRSGFATAVRRTMRLLTYDAVSPYADRPPFKGRTLRCVLPFLVLTPGSLYVLIPRHGRPAMERDGQLASNALALDYSSADPLILRIR